jgi:O-antigen/teichoic acid export membrane protein
MMTPETKTATVGRLLTSFDTSTARGRAGERYRRIALTALSSGGARATSFLTMLVSVPLIVNHFGVERYALWATITSTVALLAFADFGIGNGLVNTISESNGKDDREGAIAYVSTGFFVLLTVALFGALLLWIFYPVVPWHRIFNLNSPVAIREAGPAAAIYIVCFLAQLPLGVVQRIQLGYQEGFFTQMWIAAGNLLGLASMFVIIHVHAGLPWLVFAVAGAPVLAGVVNAVIVFRVQRPWLRPRFDRISRKATSRIIHLGFLFLIIQIAGAIGYQTDNLIIAQVLGAASVAQYAIPFRLFSITPAFISLAMAPLWPAYAEAASRGDMAWIKATLKRSMFLGLGLAVPANLLLIVLARSIIRLWVGTQIIPTFLLLGGLAGWAVFCAINGSLAVFLNGIGLIRFQALCAVLMAISNIVLSIYLTQHIGIAGVIYGSIASQVLCIFIPYAIFLPRLAGLMTRSQRLLSAELPLSDSRGFV